MPYVTYYQQNREAILKRNAAYRARKRAELAEHGKEYYRANKEVVKKKARDARQQAKMEAFEALGCKCVHCGFSDLRALQIDHVYGRGNRDPFKKGEIKYYRHVTREVKSGSPKFQLLCANCNWIKRYTHNEHS